MLTPMKLSTDAEMATFEDDCFRSWLNRIDARIDYDVRRSLGSVRAWRENFDLGQCENDAIADRHCASENRAFCSEC